MSQAVKRKCPQCGRPAIWDGNPHRPFCSDRCKLLDLGSWAMEKYRIAGEANEAGSSVEPGKQDEGEDER
jgi:hypothetical protein